VTTTIPPPLVINGQTITANSQGNFVVGTQTLTTNSQGNIFVGTQNLTAGGPAITVSGSTISLGPGVTAIVYGGSSTTNLGSVIQSFIGAPPQYTGAAVKGVALGELRVMWMVGLVALMV
jgi:large exoprotein involved in heme utilization and adhesion